MRGRGRLFVALDQMAPDEALRLALKLRDAVGGFKVGLELFALGGAAVVQAIADLGRPIFLDLKLHDIPQTVSGAVRAVRLPGVRYLTVHAAGGGAMLRAAREAAGEDLQLLAVTLLTSIDREEAERMGIGAPEAAVARLAAVAWEAGVRGFITSGEEVARVRRDYPDAVVGVPGIRRSEDAAGDQSRVTTPLQAVRRGATFLVVGRPITQADAPVAAAEAIVQEIGEGEGA